MVHAALTRRQWIKVNGIFAHGMHRYATSFVQTSRIRCGDRNQDLLRDTFAELESSAVFNVG